MLVGLLWCTGSPRYLKEDQEEEAAKPKHLEISDNTLGVMFQLYMWHLLLFIALPEALLKSSKTTLNFDVEVSVAGPSNNVSSANKA